MASSKSLVPWLACWASRSTAQSQARALCTLCHCAGVLQLTCQHMCLLPKTQAGLLFPQVLLLHHPQTVLLIWSAVKALASVPEATQVSVEPFSTDDWEMVEQNAGHMEEQLCNQVPALKSSCFHCCLPVCCATFPDEGLPIIPGRPWMHACAERPGMATQCPLLQSPFPPLQVGVVSKGHPFIFFVRGRTVLRLKVAAAEPASLVRLVPGAEVAVAPRPRVARQAHRAGPLVPAAAHGEEPENEELPEIWLRVQVRDQSAGSQLVLMMRESCRTKESIIMGLGS